MLEIGVKAPEFKLQDKDGNLVSLSDFKNKKVVLYFYPKDSTPGCTKQACSFRDNYENFKSKDVVVIGISKDTVKSHERFAQKNELPFILLSDPELDTIVGNVSAGRLYTLSASRPCSTAIAVGGSHHPNSLSRLCI